MPRHGFDEVILVTGYPAFTARQLVAHILTEQPGALVHAVVHGKLAEQAEEHLASLPAEQRVRVELIDGDAAHMDLGLPGRTFRALTAEIDRIYHFAQLTYLGVDSQAAEHLNIGGTREAIEVALACRGLRSFVHLSTAYVSGDRVGVVREDELSAGQHFRNTFEETKARAERLVASQRTRLPTVVLRPTMTVGDSRTGEVDRLDGPYLMVLLILSSPVELAIPLPGRGDAPLHMVPVDYVVRAAHALGQDARAVGRTFHLVDQRPPTAREAFELVARAGGRRGPRGFIPANLTKALLRTPGLERFARSPRAFVEQLITDVRYDATSTNELLDGRGITCPPFASYVDQLVAHVRSRVHERREQRPAEESEVDDPLS
jgi:thioester reductase-like protein